MEISKTHALKLIAFVHLIYEENKLDFCHWYEIATKETRTKGGAIWWYMAKENK